MFCLSLAGDTGDNLSLKKKPDNFTYSEWLSQCSYLKIIIEGCDLGAGVVIDVGDPGRVVQVSVEELQVLTQTVSRCHAPTQTVIAVLYGPAGGFAVDTN